MRRIRVGVAVLFACVFGSLGPASAALAADHPDGGQAGVPEEIQTGVPDEIQT